MLLYSIYLNNIQLCTPFHDFSCLEAPTESISYLGLKIWHLVLLELKELTSVNAFKNGIKNDNQKNVAVGYVSSTYQI